jgi:mannose-6-phosphate isomerase
MAGSVPPMVHLRERPVSAMSASAQIEIGPVTLRPLVRERVWGSQTLPAWLPAPEKDKPIGEAWLTAGECLIDTATSHGATFTELISRSPAQFSTSSSAPDFPLLIKLLFPHEKLSVQVHPDDALAHTLGQPRGKTECWYVLSADPGASVMVGFAEQMSPAQVREAIAAGTLEQKLRSIPVKAGDMVYIPAGTVHAIGPGMMLLEVQQTSDITYRLFDYGRQRELHIEDGLAATKTSTEAGVVAPVQMAGFTRLIASPYFVIDRFAAATESTPLGKPGELQILIALDEGCFLECSKGTALPLLPGRAVILPSEPVVYNLRSAFGSNIIRIAEK